MNSSFIESVAAKAGQSPESVSEVLLRHNVVESPAPPASRQLRVLNVAFSGEKIIHGRTEGIDFKWEPKKSGVNIIASDDNFAGKSSILQIILWALRGEPKSLTSTVQSWIRNTQVELLAGDRRVRVKIDVQRVAPTVP